ncbi:response regulator [Paenibacillus flagellatus]|uniref:Histidine kinase n=1 Tax=Paenibacillus flagellatus TaxID=2211139 RepID=A0A2V5JUD9_9BACL|nr:response regulator [Paenibacillus flagellatus]PYI49961.1 histidine kinase [Paenibacillus flagellatus]
MNFLLVDDEPLALGDLEQALKEAVQDCIIYPFATSGKALTQAKSVRFDAAFLDIELGSTSGLALAKQLKDIQPYVHIIFVTSFAKYAVDAFRIHATGYLMKPVLKEDILRELTFIYEDSILTKRKKVRVQTFGGFEVFVNGKPLQFKRAKAKELLACLIDRRGASLTTAEACALLWEDDAGNPAKRDYFRTIVKDLRESLQQESISHILRRWHGRLAIDPEQLDCDCYRFMDGDPQAVNSYRHDYLPSYSWAEFSVTMFE